MVSSGRGARLRPRRAEHLLGGGPQQRRAGRALAVIGHLSSATGSCGPRMARATDSGFPWKSTTTEFTNPTGSLTRSRLQIRRIGKRDRVFEPHAGLTALATSLGTSFLGTSSMRAALSAHTISTRRVRRSASSCLSSPASGVSSCSGVKHSRDGNGPGPQWMCPSFGAPLPSGRWLNAHPEDRPVIVARLREARRLAGLGQ